MSAQPEVVTLTPIQQISRLLTYAAIEFHCARPLIGADDSTPGARAANVLAARHSVMWALRKMGYSYPAIGRMMHRDHTTVMYAMRKFEQTPDLHEPAARVLASVRPDHKRCPTCHQVMPESDN